jgi:hypothetical protein
VPIAIRGTERILKADGVLVNRGASVEIEFAAPVDPKAFGNGKRTDLVNVVRETIAAMV